MTTLTRWMKFNAVGVLGMGVQLVTLAGLNRLWAGHYLVATCAALEVTLLHNFLWHERFTWRDRREEMPRLRALLRFHLANGVVSLGGNLLLMRLLVQHAHVPVVLANAVAIVCCSLANFAVSSGWAFAAVRPNADKRRRPMHASLMLLFALIAVAPVAAQSADQGTGRTMQLPEAPVAEASPVTHSVTTRNPGNWSYIGRIGVICGLGASTSSVATKPAFGCGAGMTLVPLPVFIEVGVMGPQANRSYLTGYLSVDGSVPLGPIDLKYLPQVLLGYSRLFETGHALDYGLALALPRSSDRHGNERSLRLEVRDYWTFANPSQHNVMLRIGWMAGLTD